MLPQRAPQMALEQTEILSFTRKDENGNLDHPEILLFTISSHVSVISPVWAWLRGQALSRVAGGA